MDDAPIEVLLQNQRFRIEKYKSILRQQFQLVYFGHFSFEDSENMCVQERQFVYDILFQQKKEEKEAYEKAMAAQKAEAEARRKKHKPVRRR